MSLFQNIITQKHIASQNGKIKPAYELFAAYFHNAAIQGNILASKEEQFQEGFLRELFVKILGYTLNPDPDFNLITERKNEKDAKKADGAIIIKGEVVGIIELKDHKTIDLKQIETQAFGYKNNHRKATYVITSNFEKLRFYIDYAGEFEEFNLFTLTEERFAVLWLCLSYENIAKDLPKQLKAESVNSENDITKKLYKDYSEFKRALFADLVANNPAYDQLTLFKKSQKLLDRLLFILFAEDCGLLPANSMKGTVDKWKVFNDDPMNDSQPLYTRFQRYFHLLNVGHKDSRIEVFAYNGGLFKPDDVLDVVAISDELLSKHTLILAEYNFASEVDVNILGHIFENSLTEIEEITNSIIAGEATPQTAKATSKRKKDGVFYTPRYITTYIVENTLGKLCTDKKAELQIDESEYHTDKKRQKATKLKLEEKLLNYRNWLLQLTICDPACGSGAFLNAALDYLMSEHRLVDDMRAKIFGGVYQLFENIENAILENNLFGVDINEESVEIAKLALWLRTAKPHRKLNSLNNNIKCGNSLISDPEVAGDKAFDWLAEFPQVFAKGGFDVVIGNPPYVFARENGTSLEKSFYAQNYVSAKYQVNTYILFIEKSFKLVKQEGFCGLIVPNSWLMIYSGEDLRRFIMENCTLDKIANLKGKSFEDANVETVILIADKTPSDNNVVDILSSDEKSNSFVLLHTKKQSDFAQNKGLEFNVFSDEESSLIIERLKTGSKNLDEICSVKAGLKAYERGKGTPKQSEVDVKERPYDFDYQYNPDTYKYLDGSNVQRYGVSWSGLWLWYGQHLAAPRNIELFTGEKIIVREITGKYPKSIIGTYSDEAFLFNMSNIAIIKREEYDVSLKYVTAILNSSLMSYYFTKNTAKAERKLFPKIILNDLRLFPIKSISPEAQQPFIDLADKMLALNAELQGLRSKFLRRLQDNFEGIKITGALEKFDTLDFAAFVRELGKQKLPLSLKAQDEWEEYFTDSRNSCQTLTTAITTTDQTIDKMVYELYGLTEEEVMIIEK